jgi:hypothetical protein
MPIEAHSKSIRSLILEDSYSFRIPIYQRSYSWKPREQVRKLLEDILEFAGETGPTLRRDYYIGNIILKKMQGGGFSSSFAVIDGQQRITSVILMLCALRELYLESSATDEERSSARAITHALYRDDGETIRIKLNNMEHQKSLNLILSGKLDSIGPEDRSTNYWANFQFLKQQLAKLRSAEDWRLQDFAAILDRVKVVAIFLSEEQDENSVFESINSAGMPLAGADLIKNFVFTFQFQPTQQQLRELEDLYSGKFEQQFSGYTSVSSGLEEFFRQYLAVKTGRLVKQDAKVIYYEFKKWAQQTYNVDSADACRALITDLNKWATIYNMLRVHGHDDIDANSLGYLRGSFNTYATLLMDMVDKLGDASEGCVVLYDAKEFNRAIARLTAYDASRFLAGQSARPLATFIPTIPKRLEDRDANYFHDYASAFGTLISSVAPGQRQPSVSEIRTQVEAQNLYANPKTLMRFLILLENLGQNEQISFESGLKGCEIEHIMPQTLGPEWSHVRAEEHQRWLHNLGNLSITFDNVTLGNKSLAEKRQLLAERSRVRLNKMLLDYEVFGTAEIHDRSGRLLNLFVEAYELPDSPWSNAPRQTTNVAFSLTPQSWLDDVRSKFHPVELVGFPIARYWSEICGQLSIDVGGNSARRALEAWRSVHRPSWPTTLA